MNHNTDRNFLTTGAIAKGLTGIGPVTRDMVHARTMELAQIAGRARSEVTQADYEQARRELTGKSDRDQQDEILESLPEEGRSGLVLDDAGREDPEPPGEEADDEGRNESAQLVEEGLQEAEHDLMLQSARSTVESDRREKRGR
jgi:hypothetical protein